MSANTCGPDGSIDFPILQEKRGEVVGMFSQGLGDKYAALNNVYEQVISTINKFEEYEGYTLIDDAKENLLNLKYEIESELQNIFNTNNSLSE